MLTKEHIDRYRVYDCGREDGDVYSKCDCPLLRKILDQATQAIDLAAENERLKAKLDAVKAFCNDNYITHCYTEEAQIGYDTAKELVRQIIDKDGDKDG